MPMAADISRSCDSSSAGQLKDCTVYMGSLNIIMQHYQRIWYNHKLVKITLILLSL